MVVATGKEQGKIGRWWSKAHGFSYIRLVSFGYLLYNYILYILLVYY